MAKILLVEDEINIASFIERGLKEFGHSVTVCHDGDTGWKILQDKPFDLLILDIIMPKINGMEQPKTSSKDWMREQMIISSNLLVSKNWKHASKPC